MLKGLLRHFLIASSAQERKFDLNTELYIMEFGVTVRLTAVEQITANQTSQIQISLLHFNVQQSVNRAYVIHGNTKVAGSSNSKDQLEQKLHPSGLIYIATFAGFINFSTSKSGLC
jgi:hypothetical protein